MMVILMRVFERIVECCSKLNANGCRMNFHNKHALMTVVMAMTKNEEISCMAARDESFFSFQ